MPRGSASRELEQRQSLSAVRYQAEPGNELYALDLRMLVHRDAAQLTVVLGEMNGGDDDIVSGIALGGQAGD